LLFDRVLLDAIPIACNNSSPPPPPPPPPPQLSIDLELDAVDEDNEMTVGASVPHNGDFDEHNRDPLNEPVDDTQPDAHTSGWGGHRILDGDNELRQGRLRLEAVNLPVGTQRVRWRVSLPDGMKMWQWWPNGNQNRPYPHWGMVISDGQLSRPDVIPQLYEYRLEGISPSLSARDILVDAYVEPYTFTADPKSDQATATIGPAVELPQAPENLAATAVGTERIDLAWSPPSSGPVPTGYDVWRSVEEGFSLGEGQRIATNIIQTSFQDTTATPGRWWYYRVTARVGDRISPPSNEASAIIGQPQPTPGVAAGAPERDRVDHKRHAH
jgi:hypothetical protein